MTAPLLEQDITPWYRQFWPWFLIALPASVVVAGTATVFIAINGADSLVVDDYYKQGLGINRLLAQDQEATALGITAEITLDNMVGETVLRLQGGFTHYPEQLTLLWAHPADQALDFSISLQKVLSGNELSAVYKGDLSRRVSGRWYLQLSSKQPPLWRLKQAVVINAGVDSEDAPQLISLSAIKES